ncbi:MAG: sulfite exporter TauE/SafE family protein, partial [Deltaproteobacteria bacterium]|nr:sulfite exporter TauE/SafE family protein [Deltaproteobacteria bacterium]
MSDVFLITLSFFTSAFNAAVGFGGGVLLIAVMTSFLPPAALVPIHGVVQLASNASRNLFGIKNTDWTILPPFLLGAALGTTLGSQIVISFPVRFLPLALGLFILLVTWTPKMLFNRMLRGNF